MCHCYNWNISIDLRGGNMEKVIGDLIALKEDHPELIITDDLIKKYIEDNIGDLIDEIRAEL